MADGLTCLHVSPGLTIAPFFGRPWSSLSTPVVNPTKPSAIIRLVISVRVNAIKFVVGIRSTSHVFKKSLEGTQPTFADGNSSAAVVGISISLGTRASTFHCAPSTVFPRLLSAVMGLAMKRNPLKLQTSAALMMTRIQVGTQGNTRLAAITQAVPCHLFAAVLSTTSDEKPTVSHFSPVQEFHTPIIADNVVSGNVGGSSER